MDKFINILINVIVTCDVLRRIKLPFLRRQHKLYLIFFCVSNFRKVGIFAAFGERQKVKSVSASRGFAPTLLTRGSIHGFCWGLRHQTPVYRGLTVAFGGPPTFWRRH